MGSGARTDGSRRGRLIVALAAAIVCLAVPARSGALDGIDLRIDFETGDASQFSGLECPHPTSQFQVYAAGTSGYPRPRQGTYAARFSETSSDVWSGNNMVRCLGARYDSGETTGRDYYFGLSVYIPPTGLSDNLIWELHHPSQLYSISACGVAPFALTAHSGALVFRIFTGNCTPGAGFAYQDSNIPIAGLGPMPRDQWIDFVFHVDFEESNSGSVQVWSRVGGTAWPASPQISRVDIPTMPFCSAQNIHNVKLYTEMGLYTGYSPYSAHDSIVLDGYRRGTTRESVMAEFPGAVQRPASTAAPVVTGSPVDGAVLTTTLGSWSGSPTSYGYAWQSSRDGGATWQTIAGATSSTLLLNDALVGASVRAVVTATNATGSASSSSGATALIAPVAIVQNIEAGDTLGGTVVWTATPSAPVKQIVFALDSNKITYADASAPYSYQLDTTKLANGPHTLGLTVTLLDGSVVWQPYQIGTVTVDNAAASPPVATAAPVVSGSPTDGLTLSASSGTWTNNPTATAYAWQSSRDGGTSWQVVAGASSSALTLTDGLIGARVRVLVTASNAVGSASAASVATAAVAPPSILQNISVGETLSGTVTWTATLSAPVKQVVFALDGNKITYTDASAPYAYQLDTTRLANGTHVLGLTVTLVDGTVVWQPYQIGNVTVSN